MSPQVWPSSSKTIPQAPQVWVHLSCGQTSLLPQEGQESCQAALVFLAGALPPSGWLWTFSEWPHLQVG